MQFRARWCCSSSHSPSRVAQGKKGSARALCSPEPMTSAGLQLIQYSCCCFVLLLHCCASMRDDMTAPAHAGDRGRTHSIPGW